MGKAKKDSPAFPRLHWTRSPVQKPHSSPKGEKGYSRKAGKQELRERVKGN